MVLSGQARTTPQTVAVYASIVLTAIITWLTLRVGERLVVKMGQTGIRVMTRIMGLLLAAIAVQFVITGVREAMSG
jgi:multiple antibiotic resistance protein